MFYFLQERSTNYQFRGLKKSLLCVSIFKDHIAPVPLFYCTLLCSKVNKFICGGFCVLFTYLFHFLSIYTSFYSHVFPTYSM